MGDEPWGACAFESCSQGVRSANLEVRMGVRLPDATATVLNEAACIRGGSSIGQGCESGVFHLRGGGQLRCGF